MEKTLEFGPKDVPVDDLDCGRSSTELQAPGPGQSDAQTLPEPGFKAATVDNANRSGAFFSISHRSDSAASHETRALSGNDFGRKRSAN
ncbi:hypothetical protein FG05_30256 [Fusarium graminearum]|nr:hypothetical protein FG05_30256 [Fusarium graminearum]